MSISKITERTHVTVRRIHITMTETKDGTEHETIVDAWSTVTTIPPDQKIKRSVFTDEKETTRRQ